MTNKIITSLKYTTWRLDIHSEEIPTVVLISTSIISHIYLFVVCVWEREYLSSTHEISIIQYQLVTRLCLRSSDLSFLINKCLYPFINLLLFLLPSSLWWPPFNMKWNKHRFYRRCNYKFNPSLFCQAVHTEGAGTMSVPRTVRGT